MAPKTPTEVESKPLDIFSAMNAIMTELGPISKSKVNTEQNYKFRGIDAAMDALNPLMSKHGIFPTIADIETILYETVTSKAGRQGYHLIRKYTYALFAKDGTSVKTMAEGEAIDYGDKAVAKCQSVAYREMLYKTFVAPFETSTIDPQGSVDIEDQNHDLIDPNAKKPAAPAPAAPRATTPPPAPRKPQTSQDTTKPQRLITEYGINLNKQKWEDYWIIKLSVRQHEKKPDGTPQWTMENMWQYFDEMVQALYGGKHIEQLTIDQSRTLEAALKKKLEDIISEEAIMRAKVQQGETSGSRVINHNPPEPVGKTQSQTRPVQASRV